MDRGKCHQCKHWFDFKNDLFRRKMDVIETGGIGICMWSGMLHIERDELFHGAPVHHFSFGKNSCEAFTNKWEKTR